MPSMDGKWPEPWNHQVLEELHVSKLSKGVGPAQTDMELCDHQVLDEMDVPKFSKDSKPVPFAIESWKHEISEQMNVSMLAKDGNRSETSSSEWTIASSPTSGVDDCRIASEIPLSSIHVIDYEPPARDNARSIYSDGSIGPSSIRRRRGYQVSLHVYDLESITSHVNKFLKPMNLGAFHCGVEVLGVEWFASGGDSDRTGVVFHRPRMHSVHIYRETVDMGESPLTEDAIKLVLCDAMDRWPQTSYHPIARNCAMFAEELLQKLMVPTPFPDWVHGAANVGKSEAVFPIADYGIELIKWYHSTPPPQAPMMDICMCGNNCRP